MMETGPKIKFCGLMTEADIEVANKLHPDWVGFVCVPSSRRYRSLETFRKMKERLDTSIPSVAVVVDASDDELEAIRLSGIADILQFHGTESPERILEWNARFDGPIWKAFSMQSVESVDSANESPADLVLLDTGKGGTGQTFDWSLLADITRPYLLAGGINSENVGLAVDRWHPYGLDVSSGIETDGVKDPNKMKQILRAIGR